MLRVKKASSLIQKIHRYEMTAKNVFLKPLELKNLPTHVQIEITTFCNMDCLSCGRRYIIDKGHHMSFNEFEQIYNQIKPRNVNLSGLGEPLLNPEIFKMIEHCRMNGSVVNFPTNLSLSEKIIEKLVDTQIDQLKVSIDASTPEMFRMVRRSEKFNILLRNIRLINNIKKKKSLKYPEIRFNFALQKYNIDELPKLITLAKELNVSTIYIQDLNYFSVEKEKEELCGFNLQKLREILDTSEQIARKNGINTNISNWKRNLDRLYNKMLSKDQFVPNAIKCNFPWVSTFIDVHGNVKPCPVFVWERNAKSLGNCLEQSFKKIWNNESYKKLRWEFKRNIRSNPICERCVPPNILDMKLILQKMILRK